MAFDNAWDETDQGGAKAATIDDLIEATRAAVRERANVEHTAYADETGHPDVWRHRKESGRTNYGLAANKPATVADGMVDGALYFETDFGVNGRLVRYDSTAALWKAVGSPDHSGLAATYTTGTVTVTAASAVVTGAGTSWATNVTANDFFRGPDGLYYPIASVDSITQLTLGRAYAGTTANGQAYTVYLDGHPAYLPKAGGTVDGAVTITGNLTVIGTLTAPMPAGSVSTNELADNAASQGQFASASDTVTTSSATYVDLANMTVTLTTSGKTGSFVAVDFVGCLTPAAGGAGADCAVVIDGAVQSGSVVAASSDGWAAPPVIIAYLASGLAAGSHTIKIQYAKVGTYPCSMQARHLRVVEHMA